VEVYFRDGWHMHDVRAARGVPLQLRGQPVVIDEDIFSSSAEMLRFGDLNDLYMRYGLKRWAVVGFQVEGALWGLPFWRAKEQY
jgi:hypothetical protein